MLTLIGKKVRCHVNFFSLFFPFIVLFWGGCYSLPFVLHWIRRWLAWCMYIMWFNFAYSWTMNGRNYNHRCDLDIGCFWYLMSLQDMNSSISFLTVPLPSLHSQQNEGSGARWQHLRHLWRNITFEKCWFVLTENRT